MTLTHGREPAPAGRAPLVVRPASAPSGAGRADRRAVPARRHFDSAEQKLGLVQYSTPTTWRAREFRASPQGRRLQVVDHPGHDLSWASTPGNVSATVTVGTADDPAKTFTYPMEFSPIRDTWSSRGGRPINFCIWAARRSDAEG